MNIVQIVAYYPPHLGGMERFVEALSNQLVAQGSPTKVFTSNQGAGKAHDMRQNGLFVRYLSSIEIAHTPIIFGLFAALLKQPRDSIFHIHVSQAFTPEITMLAAAIRKIPYFAHVHLDVDPSGAMGFLLKPYKRIFLRFVLHHARSVICLSAEQRQQMIAKYGLEPKQVVVIPNAVDERFFIHREFPAAEFRLLFVGRLASQKRVDFLLRMISHIQHPVTLDIVGDGELRGELESYCQTHALRNVVFHGALRGDDLLNKYKQATIAVTSSRKEGQSLALLEAMAAGLPIVATDGEGITNLVEGNGIVTPADEKLFANAIDALLDNEEQIRAISAHEQIAARQYSWPKLIQNLLELYNPQ